MHFANLVFALGRKNKKRHMPPPKKKKRGKNNRQKKTRKGQQVKAHDIHSKNTKERQHCAPKKYATQF